MWLTLLLAAAPLARCLAPSHSMMVRQPLVIAQRRRSLLRCTADDESELLKAIEQAATFALRKGNEAAPVTALAIERAGGKGRRSARAAEAVKQRIEMAASSLEDSRPTPLLADGSVDGASGAWQLRYSDASEIASLVKLPLGLVLRQVVQRVDLDRGIVENRAEIGHVLRLMQQRTRVVAKAWADEPEAVNKAGVVNLGNRLAVKFTKVVISLPRILVLPTPFLRIVAKPNGPTEKEGRTPTLDITYLTESMRISRGGDGSLFVLSRVEDTFEPLEVPGEDVVDSSRGFDGSTGKVERLGTKS